jgi:phosphatidylinositol kinase/protein kinase (PI-3  family)
MAHVLSREQIVVIDSERIIVIAYGRNGCWYQYLLKGEEDILMDESIMQLFELMNTIL